MNTSEMRRRIATLYTKVFTFLRVAMEWYTARSSKKVRLSFNENLYKTLQRHVEDIRHTSDSVFRSAQVCALAEGREVRLTVEETYTTIQDIRRYIREDRTRKHQMEQQLAVLIAQNQERNEDLRDQQYRKQLGYDLCSLLEHIVHDKKNLEVRMEQIKNANEEKIVVEVSSAVKRSFVDEDIPQVSPAHENGQLSSFEVVKSLDRLRPFIVGKCGVGSIVKGALAFASEEVIYQLQGWSTASTSQLLWLAGPEAFTIPSNVSAAATGIIASADALNIPIISHICHRGSLRERSSLSPEEAGLIGLVYSLIQQMCLQLDSQHLVIAQSRLAELDGSLCTWNVAVALFSDLLMAAPPLLLCVIDGLNILDYGANTSRCAQFFSVFWNALADNNKVFKLLLTTSGLSKTLSQDIPPEYLHVVEPGRRQRESNVLDGDSPLRFPKQYQVTATPTKSHTQGDISSPEHLSQDRVN